MDTCIICYSNCNNILNNDNCVCKFNIHLECYQEMKNKCKISCPICRVGIIKNEPLYSERYTISYRNIENLSKSLICMINHSYIGYLFSLLIILLFLIFIL